ncbi:DUF3313 domain-containing protein [Aquitalea sp. S1-19]|nr:DUF3313 domain-containing protein [Aquitalea sp. S1-19]
MKMKQAMLATLVALGATACSTTGMSDGASVENKPRSGFISNYSQLKPEGQSTMRYINRTANWKAYNKIMFEPVAVILSDNPEYSVNSLSPAVKKRIADGMLNAFRQELAQDFQLVNAPGPDVIRVRSAITGIQAVDPALTPTDFIPVKALFNAGREVTGTAPRVVEITAEMEILDPNNRQIAAGVASRKADESMPQGKNITWDDMDQLIKSWAKRFHTVLLDAKRG